MRLLLLFFVWLLALPALAQEVPKVQSRLIAEDKAVAPGGSISIALEEKIAPGWHTYWKNPGDAGAPTEIEWSLPAGWKAEPIQLTRAKREAVGALLGY